MCDIDCQWLVGSVGWLSLLVLFLLLLVFNLGLTLVAIHRERKLDDIRLRQLLALGSAGRENAAAPDSKLSGPPAPNETS